jgi:hypothetical protein
VERTEVDGGHRREARSFLFADVSDAARGRGSLAGFCSYRRKPALFA